MALSLFLETHRRWRRRLALSPERHLLVPFRRVVPAGGGRRQRPLVLVSPASSSKLLLLSTKVLVVLGDDRIGHVRSIRIVRRRRRRVRAKIVSNRFVRRGSPKAHGGVDVVLSRRHDAQCVSAPLQRARFCISGRRKKNGRKMARKTFVLGFRDPQYFE